MKSRLVILIAVFVAFTAWTFSIVADQGYTGFLALATQEPWAAQMLVDLVIALVLFMGWMLRDAREHGIPAWPYAGLILVTGSIGALAYLIHRTARDERAPAPSTA